MGISAHIFLKNRNPSSFFKNAARYAETSADMRPDMRPICGRYAESGPKYLAKIALFLIFFLQARPHKLTIYENGKILLKFLYFDPGKAPQTNEFQKSVCFPKKTSLFQMTFQRTFQRTWKERIILRLENN